ncbi:MAG: D-arabinono-1,4-lactone oxidase [Ktedonobacterales bacterium]
MATTSPKLSQRQNGRHNWTNWSGSVKSRPSMLLQPKSVEELTLLVRQCGESGRHLRVVGSGHSFTPLVQTDDVLMSLENLQGIESVDAAGGTATVLGGTRLKRLGDALLAQGLAQENLGDIDVQSIAGAVSTGTHGTGTHFGTLSTQVEGMTLVSASGDLIECSPDQNPDVFKAAQVSIGALGVIARLKLRVVPAQHHRYQVRRERLVDCLASLETYKQENSHFEFFWLPYTSYVQAKFLNETAAPATSGTLWGAVNKIVLENWVYWLLSESCRLVPGVTRTVAKLSGEAISPLEEVDYSHRLFATPRMVRFQEMEYNLPAEQFSSALAEIKSCIERHRFNVHFPIECRFVRADDIWLSPAYQRDSAYIAVHMYRGMPYQDYFHHIEAIFRRYQGRPHWGKMHTRTAAELAALYPRWEDFRRIRRSLDPSGLFLNDYLRSIFEPGPLDHLDVP